MTPSVWPSVLILAALALAGYVTAWRLDGQS